MNRFENFEKNEKPKIVGEKGNYEITFVSGKILNVKDVKVYKDFLVVQSIKNDRWKIADKFGNLSESFSEFLGFIDGFFVLKDKEGKNLKYRDLLGRTTDIKTESGLAYYRFLNGETDINDLRTYWLNDIRFLVAIAQAYVKKIVSDNPAKYNTLLKQNILHQQITNKLQNTLDNHFIQLN